MDIIIKDRDIKTLHNDFPVFRKYIYMNTGWCAPRSKKVQGAIDAFSATEIEEGVANLDVWKLHEAARSSLRKRLAAFFNANEDEIAITQNTSSGINIVVTCLDFKEDDEIIISSEEHPAGIVPWIQLKRLKGVNIKILNVEPPEALLNSLRKKITRKTKLIMLSHISCMSGYRFPIKQISEISRECGIPLLVDGAQSAGHINVDFNEIGCDFYAIPGQKWMLGPESTGALFVRHDLLAKTESINAGYRSIKSLDSEKLEMEIHPAARRFEMYDTNCSLVAGLDAGIEILTKFGIEAVEKRIRSLADKMIKGLANNKDIKVLTPASYDGKPDSGLVALRINGRDASSVTKELYEKYRIIVRYFTKENILRFSVNFFNTEEEISKAVDALKKLTV